MSAKYYVLCDNNCKYEGMKKEQILTAIEQAVSTGTITDVDAGFVTTLKTIDGKALRFFWGTRAEYDKLSKAQKEGLFALITDDTTSQELFDLLNKIVSGDQVVGMAEYAERARGADYAREADYAASDAEGNDIPSTYQRKLYQHNICLYFSGTGINLSFSFLSTRAVSCENYEDLTYLLAPIRNKLDNDLRVTTGMISATGVYSSSGIVYGFEQYSLNGSAHIIVYYVKDGTPSYQTSVPNTITDNVIEL